jgi:hypothetical protein
MAGTATYIGADTTTQGNWIGNYGGQGYGIACGVDATTDAISTPSGITVVEPTALSARFRYDGASADVKALEYPSAGSRVSAVWYDTPRLEVEITDSSARYISMYFWDAVDDNRAVTVTVASVTGAVATTIETRNIAVGFGTAPVYLKWLCTGHVRFTVTHTAGTNAIFNGYFIGLAPQIRGSFVLGADGTVDSTLTGLVNLDDTVRTVTGPGVLFVGGSVGMIEQAAPPDPIAGTALIFAEDNGSGKLRLMCQFPTGSAQQLSIEP